MADFPICQGRGVTCIDDLCRGAGYCMHGDGNCPNRIDDDRCEWDDDDDRPGAGSRHGMTTNTVDLTELRQAVEAYRDALDDVEATDPIGNRERRRFLDATCAAARKEFARLMRPDVVLALLDQVDQAQAAGQELARVREALDGIASPLHIDGENHMAAVKHARAAIARAPQGATR